MRFVFIVLTTVSLFCTCKEASKETTLVFKPLQAAQFNFSADNSFVPPNDDRWEQRRIIHDSCMGESFAANAIFMKTKDTFNIGCIVNMQTLKVVRDLDIKMLPQNSLSSVIGFFTAPCYQKMQIDIPAAKFMNLRVSFVADGATDAINRELTDIFNHANSVGLETGSWLNFDLKDGIANVLDTTNNRELLAYKEALTDTANMVLVRSSAMTDISLFLNPEKISAGLLNVLRQKPLATLNGSALKAKLFLIGEGTVKVQLNGFFQVVGQFMQVSAEQQ
ncbi:hypothetical protein I5907_15950 [Panacibacter sp. DH6]|uniref:Uncharacterized protein n=1 Tax=Panacibacter microcysteis TaxID=2793269 RepID=A0A931E9E5_9BACT|nr:hypothetical protein [Panacibacter microcysteis]MBG9377735.1 hypothetical protein [Panacibacter microcysteis]